MITRVRAAIVFLAMVAIACILHIGCGDESHIFEARFFLEGRACLGTTSSVDVVVGAQPPQCPAKCLAQPFSDGGRALYVSSMCAPFPITFDASASDPECPIAVDAFNRDDTCFSDGGSSNPLPPPILDAALD